MEYRYILPGIPPSNNKFIGRKNIWEYRKVKEEWEQLIFYKCCRDLPPKPICIAEIIIEYYFPDKRRRDPDNYSGKMLLDGLRKAGVIEDDSFDNIPDIHYVKHYSKDMPRTVITVREISERID